MLWERMRPTPAWAQLLGSLECLSTNHPFHFWLSQVTAQRVANELFFNEWCHGVALGMPWMGLEPEKANPGAARVAEGCWDISVCCSRAPGERPEKLRSWKISTLPSMMTALCYCGAVMSNEAKSAVQFIVELKLIFVIVTLFHKCCMEANMNGAGS